jgi:hypothetical protein
MMSREIQLEIEAGAVTLATLLSAACAVVDVRAGIGAGIAAIAVSLAGTAAGIGRRVPVVVHRHMWQDPKHAGQPAPLR